MIWTPEELQTPLTLAVIPARTCGIALHRGKTALAVMSIRPAMTEHLRPDEAACLEGMDALLAAVGLDSFRSATMVIEKPVRCGEESREAIRAWLDAAGRRQFHEAVLVNQRGWRVFGMTEWPLEKSRLAFQAAGHPIEPIEITASCLAAFHVDNPRLGAFESIPWRGWSRASPITVSADLRSRLAFEEPHAMDVRRDLQIPPAPGEVSRRELETALASSVASGITWERQQAAREVLVIAEQCGKPVPKTS